MELLDCDAGPHCRGACRIDDGRNSGIEVKIDVGNPAFCFTELTTHLIADAGAAFAAAAIDAQKQSRHWYS